jgi:hypothetical protein
MFDLLSFWRDYIKYKSISTFNQFRLFETFIPYNKLMFYCQIFQNLKLMCQIRKIKLVIQHSCVESKKVL